MGMSNRKGSNKIFVKYADYSMIPESLGLLRRKYEELERQILESRTGTKDEFAVAEKAEYRDLLLAHDKSYIDEFMNVKLTPRIIFSGLPFSAAIRDLFLMNTGATVLTLELAIENGVAMCIGGGAIHAHRSQGAAFCLINDVAVALLRAKVLKKIQRGAVVSCLKNQTDGVNTILSNDPDMLTFSLFEQDCFPFVKAKGDIDICLGPGVEDFQYLALLKDGLSNVFDGFKPDALIYLAGSASLREDSTSTMNLSVEGLKERDEIIIGRARELGIPLAVLTSASFDPEDRHSVGIHLNTARIVKNAFLQGRT
jgi:acetoin utilization deacetylase AcuC-like enzyme